MFDVHAITVGPPFPAFKAHFSVVPGWNFEGDLIGFFFLIDGCGYGHLSAEDG